MKIETIIEKDRNEDRYTGIIIKIDDKRMFSVFEGEPEDATLYRDLNDCLFVGGLLKLAFEAGKAGEELEFIETTGEN